MINKRNMGAILGISVAAALSACGDNHKNKLIGDEAEAYKLCRPYGVAIYDHGGFDDDYKLICKSDK